jgi:hypothetical protein
MSAMTKDQTGIPNLLATDEESASPKCIAESCLQKDWIGEYKRSIADLNGFGATTLCTFSGRTRGPGFSNGMAFITNGS